MKKILIFTNWFFPAYKAGGPIKSIYNLAYRLGEKLDIYIVTTDKDIDNSKLENIQTNVWTKADNFSVYYKSSKDNNNHILKIIQSINPDIIYLNSLFSPKHSVYIIFLKWLGKIKQELIIAPRGELSQGALGIKSIKKKIYLTVAKNLGLYNSIFWHSTSNSESSDLKKTFGDSVKYLFIPNIPAKTDSFQKRNSDKNDKRLEIIFLSRICKMKNTKYIFEILKSINVKGKIELSVFGTIEDTAYWNECLEVAKELPENISWKYHGPAHPNRVPDVLNKFHLFFLPTLGENFGHAILESLQCGCPVLISNLTPWRQLEKKKIGWDLPLEDPCEFQNAIIEALKWDQKEFDRRSKNAYEYSEKIINDQSIVNKYIKLFSLNFS